MTNGANVSGVQPLAQTPDPPTDPNQPQPDPMIPDPTREPQDPYPVTDPVVPRPQPDPHPNPNPEPDPFPRPPEPIPDYPPDVVFGEKGN